MPRGVPKKGYRIRNGKKVFVGAAKQLATVSRPEPREDVVDNRTDAEIDNTLRERFEIIELVTAAAIRGDCRSVIISGPPGLGKSFTVEQMVEPLGDRATIVKGFARATGLYKALCGAREKNRIVIFDDCDSVFLDPDALNLLKGACDTTERRILSWSAETRMVDDNGDPIPTRFEFEGTVIFITNYDFDYAIAKESKMSPHFEALISRSHYVDCAMKSRRDYMIRIKQVLRDGVLLGDLDPTTRNLVIHFLENNKDKFRELTLRTAIKLGGLTKISPSRWQAIAKETMFKPVRI